MNIIKSIKLLSFLFVLGLLVASCSKESNITEETNPGQIQPTEEIEQNSLLTRSESSEDGLDLDCFTILFPFDVIDSEDETYTITSTEDFESIFDPNGETYIVDFVYPLNIEDEDGTASTIDNAEALGEAFANCLPNGWEVDAFPAYLINLENSCLTLQYPITVTDIDGNESTYDDEESFVAALAEEPLFFVFPLSLSNQDGETIVVNDVDELLTALFDCNGLDIDTTIWDDDYGFDYIGCYEIVFPFSVVLTDGTVVEVNDHMEYCDLLLEGNIQGFAFPLTLVGEEGEIVVNSQEELEALLEDCYDWDGPGEIGDVFILATGAFGFDPSGTACYTISFPMNVVEVDLNGNTSEEITINNLDELMELVTGFPGESLYNVVYPVTLTINESGEVVVLEQLEDLFQVLENCQ